MRLELGEVWEGGWASRKKKKRVCPAAAHIKGLISCLPWVPSMSTVHVLEHFNPLGLRVLHSCKSVFGNTGSNFYRKADESRVIVVFSMLVISHLRAIVNPTDFAVCLQQSHSKVTTTSLSPGSHAVGDIVANITQELISYLHITWPMSPLTKIICVQHKAQVISFQHCFASCIFLFITIISQKCSA